MKDYTVSLIQKSLLMVIILILTFDAADSRQKIKALEDKPSEQFKELTSRVESAEARSKHALEMAELATKNADFADRQAFECKQWVIDEMKKRNAEAEKRLPPSGTTYKQFMGGK